MNINNLNTYSKPSLSLAAMCLERLLNGEPNTDIVPRNNGQGRKRDYRGLNNEVITEVQMIKLMGVTRDTVRDLYSKYNGDCKEILAKHGYTRIRKATKLTKYKDQDGQQMTQRAIARKYKISSKVVQKCFELHNFDHVKSFEMLLKEIEKRGLNK